MNCPKCGNFVNAGEKFCGKCGCAMEPGNQPASVETGNDEELLRAYVGKNYDKIVKSPISICSLLFGLFYVLYRKMWLLGVMWFLLMFVANLFLPNFASLIVVVLNIAVAVMFHNLYLSNAKDEVRKIKQTSPGITPEVLKEACAKKGGTSMPALIIAIVVYALLVAYVVITVNDLIKPRDNESNVESVYYVVPGDFEESTSNSNNFKYYTYIGDGADYCVMSVRSSKMSEYYTLEQFAKINYGLMKTYTYGELTNKKINGQDWLTYDATTESGTKQSYYYISDGANNYEVYFGTYTDSGVCSSAAEKLEKSLRVE